MSRVIGLNLSCLRPVTAESSVTLPPPLLVFLPFFLPAIPREIGVLVEALESWPSRVDPLAAPGVRSPVSVITTQSACSLSDPT